MSSYQYHQPIKGFYQTNNMSDPITIEARAKVNLYLRIGERRKDGYHELQTIFHSIALSDWLEMEEAPQLEVTCSAPEVPGGPANLVYKAAERLARQYGIGRGARIHIQKTIPSQAGLGGGSADAAAALVALNQLWEIHAGADELERLGAALGADVPFCLRGGAAYAEGIGERLTPLPALPQTWLVVIKPNAAISTRLAYEALDALYRKPGPGPEGAVAVLQSGAVEKLPSILYNDFEAVALPQYPEVRRAYRALTSRLEGVLLCGSGSALFGLAGTEERARRAAAELEAEGWQAVVTYLRAAKE